MGWGENVQVLRTTDHFVHARLLAGVMKSVKYGNALLERVPEPHRSEDVPGFFISFLFYFPMKCRHLPLLEARPLRQTSPGDLTLTCRALTSCGAGSPLRTRWGQRVKAGQSPPGEEWGGGPFGSGPKSSSFQRGGDSRTNPKNAFAPEAWDPPRAFNSSPAQQAAALNPTCCGSDLGVRGAGRGRSGGDEGAGSSEPRGPLPLQLPTQALVLAAQGV